MVRGNLGIRDGKIVPATGEAREVIDGTGLTALPGLLDIVGYKVGDEINFTYVEAAGSNVSPAYEILGEGGKAPATEDAANSGAPAGDENASGEPEDDVVQDNGAAQTPADVASGEDTEKVA